jgi:hypothetical protein
MTQLCRNVVYDTEIGVYYVKNNIYIDYIRKNGADWL